MKKSRLFLVLMCLPVLLNSQATLDESILPEVGDIFITLVDNMTKIDLRKQGEDQYWDFSLLSSGLSYENALVKSDPSMLPIDFDFDFLSKDASGWLRFYERRDKRLYEVALQRPHPLNSAVVVLAKYDSPKLLVFAPMTYKKEITNRSEIGFSLSGSEIPAIIKKRLPITADSIKVIYRETTDFRIDAWGTLALSYDRFEVLRQDLSSSINTSVEIFSAGKWSAINNNILDPAGDLLGISKTQDYVFYSENIKNPIATVSMDKSGRPAFAEIKAPDEARNLVSANTNKRELILSPNPTYGDIKLELMNLDYGTYQFEVFDILSRRQWGKEIQIDRKLSSFRYDLSFLKKGSYLWAITDAQGVRITTKRLVIITP